MTAELPPLPAGAKPFELFRRADLQQVEKADLVLFTDCLAAAGYPEERAVATGPGAVAVALLRPVVTPRTEVEARRYGFGAPASAVQAEVVRKDSAFYQVASQCEQSARAQLGDPREVGALRDRYTELGNALVQDRAKRVTAILTDYGTRLSACLAGRGYALPAGRTFDARGDLSQYGIIRGHHDPVPTPARSPGGVEIRPAIPARAYRPSQAEVVFALAFVRCGVSTGLFAELDRSERAIEQEIVERHVAEFHGLNPRIEALAQRAAEVLRDR
ncbi:hypothetical protein [Kribbella amoyensis]|uniref:hypothetical protein n=1 Tax=Kribbella amoyensis TaxID=996641 RepID=UPI0011A8A412|nr:hypothetical protein [Kribbella amoyensis]